MRQCGSDVIYYQNKHKVPRKYEKVKCGVLDFSGIFFNFYKKYLLMLMPAVRGEQPDCFELIIMHSNSSTCSLQPKYAEEHL